MKKRCGIYPVQIRYCTLYTNVHSTHGTLPHTMARVHTVQHDELLARRIQVRTSADLAMRQRQRSVKGGPRKPRKRHDIRDQMVALRGPNQRRRNAIGCAPGTIKRLPSCLLAMYDLTLRQAVDTQCCFRRFILIVAVIRRLCRIDARGHPSSCFFRL